ncbi:MAG: L-2-hydroxyglutarate oxidase [Capsulimonadales bacterium]|nr:L-2-hydroxyglutarate oxidase [Capsulimonadales bacterium]
MIYDIILVGGGIVGLSAAMTLAQRFPDARLTLLEKEATPARHQTGRNSGVIHSGIYYKPGSLKAQFAREGSRSIVRFCEEQNIPHEICGKLIVATSPEELPLLENLAQRGVANGIPICRIGPEQLKEIEPHVNGRAALRVLTTGITDYQQVAIAYARLFEQNGGEIRLATEVRSIRPEPLGVRTGVRVETNGETLIGRYLINCAGLQSDRIARMTVGEENVPARIVPFRGEYYDLKPERRYLVKHLIYPVPNPNFPFLGVHFTRMIGGDVHAGPNAVLSMKREGYEKTDADWRDLRETLTYSGFQRLALKYWRDGLSEIYRSFSKAAFVRSLQRLVPEITAADITPSKAGVRAQALLPDGTLVDDFLFVRSDLGLHVCNAPSPAATASLEIGKAIVEEVSKSVPWMEKYG